MYLKDATGRDLAIVKFVTDNNTHITTKNTEYFVYGTDRVARVTNETPVDYKIRKDEATYFLYDHLGNTRVAFRAKDEDSVIVVNAMDYYSYGKILREYDGGAGDRYLTTGHERDRETGLDYRGARYYDSDIARFLSTDPWADQYPSYSTYNYVLGNPIMFIDPTGKGAEDWVKKPTGDIVWDPNAVSPETTQPGDKYVGKSGKGTDDEGNMVTYNPDGTKSVQTESQTVIYGHKKPVNRTEDLTPWMTTALQELKNGVKEIPKGSNSGPKVNEYLKSAGASPGNAWCASFVHWCLKQNGIKGAGAAGKSYLNWGVKLDKPKYGAIAIFTTGHVGFYMATMKTGNYLILHGNWSDKVSKSDNIKPSEIKQFVFPKL